MKGKTFVEGQKIDVRIRTDAGSVWCPRASYARPAATPGVHWCQLDDQQIEFSTRDIRGRRTGGAK